MTPQEIQEKMEQLGYHMAEAEKHSQYYSQSSRNMFRQYAEDEARMRHCASAEKIREELREAGIPVPEVD